MLKFSCLNLLPIGLGLTAILNASVLATEKDPVNGRTVGTNQKAKSLEAFGIIMKVIKSPRCINCHPTNDIPRQGDDFHVHPFNVSRGIANRGGLVQQCSTCHHDRNNTYSNVPGASHWSLAPKTMGWFGLSDLEIARVLLDKTRNGGRSPKDLVEHMSTEPLVLWSWNPGSGRTPPPVPVEEFRKALNEWLATGAHIPAK